MEVAMSTAIAKVRNELLTSIEPAPALRRGRSASTRVDDNAMLVDTPKPTFRQSSRLRRPSGKARSAEEQLIKQQRETQEQGHTASPLSVCKKRATVACRSCRAFKRKCSGGRPCELCTKRNKGLNCHYDNDATPGAVPIPSTPCKRPEKTVYRRNRGNKSLVVTVSTDVFVNEKKKTSSSHRPKRLTRHSSGSEVRSTTGQMQAAHICGHSSTGRNGMTAVAAPDEREATLFEFEQQRASQDDAARTINALDVYQAHHDDYMPAHAMYPPEPYATSSYNAHHQDSRSRFADHAHTSNRATHRTSGLPPPPYGSQLPYGHQESYGMNITYGSTPAYNYGPSWHGRRHVPRFQSQRHNEVLPYSRSYPRTPYDPCVSDVRSTTGHG